MNIIKSRDNLKDEKKAKNTKSAVMIQAAVILQFAIILSFLLALTGCWNNVDLAEYNFVAGIGIDRTEDGKIILTVQVVEPGAIHSTSSGNENSGGMQPKPVFVESYEGETVFEAIRGMLSGVDKKLFFSTAQVLILGEKLAQEGIEEVLDFFQRDHEVDYLMNVLVAKGVTPREILEMQTDIDSIPAMYIKETVDNTIWRGTVKKTTLIDLVKDMDCPGKQLAIGRISKMGEKTVKTEGTAVFNNGKLAGWLDGHETRGYLFVIDKLDSAIVNVPVNNGTVALEIKRSDGKISVAFENGRPSMLSVTVKTEANIGGYEGRGKLVKPEDLYMLEGNLEKEIKNEIAMVFKKIQKECVSDIFGFGKYVHKFHPQYWKIAKEDWDEIFSKLPVDINVDAKIRGTGVVRSPVAKGK